MADLCNLIYYSESECDITPKTITDIYRVSEKNNYRDNITGILTTRSRLFFQYLEGPRQLVQECFHRITMDSRHHNIVLIGISNIDRRIFDDWSMRVVTEKQIEQARLEELWTLTLENNANSNVKMITHILDQFSSEIDNMTN